MGLKIINTDAIFFIENLKKILRGKLNFVDENIFPELDPISTFLTIDHHKFCKDANFKDNPEKIYSAFFQDGVKHALEIIYSKYKSGEFSNLSHIGDIIASYKKWKKDKIKEKNYADVAYIDGYIKGISFLTEKEYKLENFINGKGGIPFYYIYGFNKDIFTLKDFNKNIKKGKTLHKSAYEYAKKFMKDAPPDFDVHHKAFLS